MLMKTSKLIKDLKNSLSKNNVLDALEERYAYSQDATNLRNIKNIPDAVVQINILFRLSVAERELMLSALAQLNMVELF